MESVSHNTGRGRFTLIFLLELCLLLVLVFGLVLNRTSDHSRDADALRQVLYSSHELAYEANYMALMLSNTPADDYQDTPALRSSFESQSQRMLQALLDSNGWLIPQAAVNLQMEEKRHDVERTLVEALNAGRKLLAVRQSLHQLTTSGVEPELIPVMKQRFIRLQKEYVAKSLKNQAAFKVFIARLQQIDRDLVEVQREETRGLVQLVLLTIAVIALFQLGLYLIYRRHSEYLSDFLQTLESFSQSGFKSETPVPLYLRMKNITRDIRNALNINRHELNKQRWKNAALEAAGEAILIANNQGKIEYVNAAFCRITGYDASTVMGENCSMLSSGQTSEEVYKELWNGLNQNGHWHGELINQRKNGDIYTQMTTITALYDEEPNSGKKIHQGYIAILRDISMRKQLEEELHTLARHDGLTGILNRKTVLDEAMKFVQWTQKYGDPLSVIVLDIDHFKAVNDQWGHPVGDKAIVRVAERAAAILPADGLIGRIGGEEFILVLPGETSSRAFKLAEELRLLIANDVVHHKNGQNVKVTCSFGISSFCRNEYSEVLSQADLLSQMVAKADRALYEAKGAGRNCVRVARDETPESDHSDEVLCKDL